ncbi:uncharacterized protein LOC116191849 isoform X4 [Punica granatum]|uniref:Uncharacterized protein LOC116191849 isoform X4 n=1 Tax=Punica granatum TaxID=22663 RepID=A0A6P8C4C2_PUNGR|nr:uncharacterized protein LOC116191849 isoform X4 [Punica granatum]
MFAKRLLEKAIQHHGHAQLNVHHGNLESKDIDFQAYIHYGIPSTASILAFDPIQRLLAIGTLDGRIKVIGGDGIEGLLISTDQLPFKHLEFLQNQCFLVSLSNGNYIQVWNLESRSAASCLQWESNITAFSVISGSSFIYIGDECGSLSVLKFDAEDGKLLRLPYHITASSIGNVAGISSLDHGPIVGVLHQHCPTGNRVLVAYQSGLLVLWDVAEAQAVFVGGDNDLQLKEEKVDSTSEVLHNPTGQYLGEKEISALCWASSDESVLAVGYVDGDILFWNTSNASSRKTQEANSLSSNVVRLQLSSEERRLPIVILQWSPLKKSHNGLLFIYGGDQIGSDELLTGCQGQEGKATISGLEYEAVIPTSNPVMTVAKLIKLPTGECLITDLVETSPAVTIPKPGNTKWPLTGGVPGELSTTKKHMIERLYISGYQDGSVRICDATHPILSSICILQREVQEVQVADSSAPVSSLDLCISTLSLAVGDDRGLVYIYNLKKSTETSSFHLVTDSNHEVHALPQERENCKAVFSLLKSPVQVLLFANDGSKLAVGYQCGQVNVLDMNSFSPLFCSDSSRGFSSPVISMTWKSCSNISNLFKTPKHRETGVPVTPADEVLFVLTKDAKVFIVEGRMKSSGSLQLKKKSSPISMYVIEVERSAPSKQAPDDASAKESTPEEGQAPNDSHDTKQPSEDSHSGDGILDSFVLLCLEDSLQLYSTKSVIQGNNKTICKVKHAKRCCWTSTFKKDEAECGLILLYQTGDIEIRSLPDLELVRESSLMSILRWNYKAKIDKTMSSDCGQIAMVNGGELAFISLTSGEANSRILEFLPCLHDKVLAAAADAALNIPSFQKKKAAVSGILEGIAKGFKVGKAAPTGDSTLNPRSTLINLEAIFSKSPFPDPSPTASNNQDVLSSSPNTDDKEPELSIDDIDIDDPIPSTSASSHKLENNKNGTEKEKLFDGATDVSEPRIRTVEEIRAKYRKVEDASSVAADARNKLLERQEKLERISRRTAELQSGAEDFASLANELVKTMENRKWWHI